MKRTAFVHIGLTKTGTTTIQNSLHLRRQALAMQGVLYPESLSFGSQHLGLSMLCYDMERGFSPRVINGLNKKNDLLAYRDRAISELQKEVEIANPEVVIFSDEGLSGLTNEREVKRLKFILEAINVEKVIIICYLRRQDSHFTSDISQKIRSGIYLEKLFPALNSESNFYYFYDKLLDLYSSVFGTSSIVPRIFEDCVTKNGTLTDFSKLVEVVSEGKGGEIDNVAMSHKAIYICNEINRRNLFSHLEPREAYSASQRMAAILANKFSGCAKFSLPYEIAKSFNDIFYDSNNRVMKNYLSSRSQLFPVLEINNSNEGDAEVIQFEDLYEVIALIAREK